MLKIKVIKQIIETIITDPAYPSLKFVWRGGCIIDIFENEEELYDNDLYIDPSIYPPTLKHAKQAVKQYLKLKEHKQ